MAMETAIPVSWEEPVANDNCGVESLNSNLIPGSSISESVQVIYTATDAADNETSCSTNQKVNSYHGEERARLLEFFT